MSHARLQSVPEVLKPTLNTTLDTNNRFVTLLRLSLCVIINTDGSYSVFSDTVSVTVNGRLPSVQSVCRVFFSVSKICASVHQFICAANCESDSSSHYCAFVTLGTQSAHRPVAAARGL